MPSSRSFATLRRVPTPLVLVGGLHLAVIWALLNGLQIHSTTSLRAPDLIADFPDPPPLPHTTIQPPQVDQQVIKFTEPPPPPIEVDTTQMKPVTFDDRPVQPRGLDHPGGTAEPESVINAAAVDPHHPLTQPPYPMSSRRLAEEGALVLDILVGADGQVHDAKVSRSSGFDRLDQAALSEAKQHWRLRPATRNGVAFEQWLTLRVVFRLAER